MEKNKLQERLEVGAAKRQAEAAEAEKKKRTEFVEGCAQGVLFGLLASGNSEDAETVYQAVYLSDMLYQALKKRRENVE